MKYSSTISNIPNHKIEDFIYSYKIDKAKHNFYLVLKRLIDIIFSGTVLFLTAPLMVLLILLIKLESKGPAFYLQERIGKFGKIFKVYKLRTMYIDYEEKGGGIKTIDDDPRITKTGKLIRRISFDEFPQFINILKGEMSYIGPRPISLAEHLIVMNGLKSENKPIPQGLIPMVKPGITGWALLHGREKISYKDRFKLNAQYENNISLWFDLKIFLLTFKKYWFTNLCVLILFLSFTAFICIKIII
ncbi:MAG: sugar transferase [bacterium]